MSASTIAAAALTAVLLETAVRVALAFRQRRALRRDADVSAHAEDYAAARLTTATLAGLAAAATTLALTLGGGVGALDALWRATPLGQPWLGAAVIVSAVALHRALQLPFALWRTFRVDARFGFNRTTWRLFALDAAKRGVLGAAVVLPASAVTLLLMEHAGAWWWLLASAAWLAAVLVLGSVRPLVVEPLFNRFTPLADRALEERFGELLSRCGFRAQGVLVMDGSRRSALGNAYFAGVGRAKRVVVHDTLLERLDAAELEAVLAHELGHYRLRHFYRRLATSTTTVAAALWIVAALAPYPELYAAFHVATPSAHAALALLAAAAPSAAYWLTPIAAGWSRQEELAADDFAVRHTSADALASALRKIYRSNAAAPRSDGWYSRFYETHPPPAERLGRLAAQPA